MAEQIASLILAHNLYIASTRGFQDDLVRACDSIGLPTDKPFETSMHNFKRHNDSVYKEMKDITAFLDTMTTKTDMLAEQFRARRINAAGGVAQPVPSEVVPIQERVKQETDRVLEAIIGKAEEATEGNTGVAAATEAEGPGTTGSSIASSTGGNTGVAPPSGSGGPPAVN